MPVARPAYFWEADVELEVENLALSLQSKDIGRGASATRVFSAYWLRDGEIVFNPAQRLAGWFRKVLPLIRSSYKEQVQAIKVYPLDGNLWSVVGNVKDITGSEGSLDSDFQLPEGLPQPLKQFIVVSDPRSGHRATTTYWYILNKPFTVRLKVVSFARGITPTMVKEALEKLGGAIGLGDKHAVGYGRFTLKTFESKEERLSL